MGKKATSHVISTPSYGSTPTSTSHSHTTSRSSILRSSFSHFFLRAHLFASVIQSFESQQLRIHDVRTGRLRQQHKIQPAISVTSLDWGYYGTAYGDDGLASNRKKRKRAEADTASVVIGYGTSNSEICMYSPAEGRVIGKLSGPHEKGIRDFKFAPTKRSEAWSIGGEGMLVQWDISKNSAIRSIPLQDQATGVLASPTQYEPAIVCASTTPFSIYPSKDFRTDSFNSLKGQVRNLIRSGRDSTEQSELFLAVDNDRYISVFDIVTRKLVRTLVAGSEVDHLDYYLPESSKTTVETQLLAAVVKDGTVELFPHPFELPMPVNGDLKSMRRSQTRKATAQVKLIGPGRDRCKIFTASLQGPDLVIVSIDNGVEPTFQRLRWQDEGTGELLFDGVKELGRVKNSSALNVAHVNGVKDMGKPHVDESRTVVLNATGDFVSQETAIEISSGEEQEEDDDDDDDKEEDDTAIKSKSTAQVADVGGDEASSITSSDAEQIEKRTPAKQNTTQVDATMEDLDTEERSFGDLLASKHPNMITIADTFELEKDTFDASKQLSLPSGMSLGTVLTQALRTNDTNLLESCLHASDVGIVQNTIQRLDSALAASLLAKLAERLASRPGRYGHLLSWVQWTCIAHGGAIAAQPDILGKIKTLYKVLTQRSKSLDKLLLLKGKLDMLDAQLAMRKQIQAQRGLQTRDSGEPGMIYIEGEEDYWSSDEDMQKGSISTKAHRTRAPRSRASEDLVGGDETSEDDDEKMPITNGVASDMEEDSASDTEADAETSHRAKRGLYDLEAEVTDEDDSERTDVESEGSDGSDQDDSEDVNDEDEDDTSMDSFINDGEISYESEDDQIDLNDDVEVRKPEPKRKRHR